LLTFEEMGLSWIDIIYIGLVGLVVYLFTYFIYPPLIKWLHKQGWVGYDIHKNKRPATAESGGLGLTFGILLGMIIMMVIYPTLMNELIVFIITILSAAVIGFIDDRKQLSSLKKIVLMVGTGLPLFVLNYIGFITVSSPTLPVLGHLRLTVIYPLIIPIIIAILTNCVNMLEGYNGEGSGTTSVATFFIIICAIIAHSAQGVIYAVPVFFAIFAFYRYNKYPAKVFPGDIGTLVMGAAIGLIGILGSLEVVMALVMLTHIFNSFYVLASVKGFKESHSIKKKDIWLDKEDRIHASTEHGAPMTLPRLILAKGSLTEEELVKHFLAMSIISGIFAIVSEIIRQWTITTGNHHMGFAIAMIISCVLLFIVVIKLYPRIFGIALIMILLLLIGLFLFFIIDQFIVTDPLNWLYSFALAGGALILWYIITIKYFWVILNKFKIPAEVAEEEQNKNDKLNEKKDAVKP
jgi:UDP-N-acetylglucosamine--dolichyl-phosphate N-acetylglucosaminephosphotransferase